jgi:hypothetical protein
MTNTTLDTIDSNALATVTGGTPDVQTSWRTTVDGWKNIIKNGPGTGYWGGYGRSDNQGGSHGPDCSDCR